MDRRKFLKKGLEGVATGIPFISGCGKNPLESNMEERSVQNLHLFF